jgi:hypothetical protein
MPEGPQGQKLAAGVMGNAAQNIPKATIGNRHATT